MNLYPSEKYGLNVFIKDFFLILTFYLMLLFLLPNVIVFIKKKINSDKKGRKRNKKSEAKINNPCNWDINNVGENNKERKSEI